MTNSSKAKLLADLQRILPDIRRPLVLAARHNYIALDKISGIDKRIKSLLAPFVDAKIIKPIKEKIEKLLKAVDGFDSFDYDEKKRRILAALSLLDALEHTIKNKGKLETDQSGSKLDKRNLYKSVQFLKGVGPKVAEFLAAKNIITVEDILYFFPRRYEDLRRVGKISELQAGSFGQGVGKIAGMSQSSTRFGKKPYEVIVQDNSGYVTLVWFHYGAKAIARNFEAGQEVRFSGKVAIFRGRKQIAHPDIERLRKEEELSTGKSIQPMYGEISGITKKRLAKIINSTVKEYANLLEDPLPDYIRKKAALPKLKEVVNTLHLPDDKLNIDHLNSSESIYHQRLAFDELFFVQLALARKKSGVAASLGYKHKRLSTLARKFYKNFPHSLTGSQKKVLSDIVDDLTSEQPMNRLLQGDVGSGKTIVAILSALLVVENKRQVALMAPTEILAEQHYQTMLSLCNFEGLRVELLTGDMARSQKLSIYQGIESGEIDFVIGTHALIQRAVNFKHLAYVIVDEQHRFGVEQRSILRQKGVRPDCLVMTATPIPRSLSLTLYGDLDVSVIDELPKGRQPISTRVLWLSEQKRAESVLEKELGAGRQAYVITPLVSESEKLDLTDAVSEQQRLEQRFPNFTIGLLHGRMSGDDKERIMRAFKDKTYDILVSTSVVEVGVDVANASVMVIQHAERFGLSQLHQLRGRVGRGSHESYCFLMCERVGEEARERLSIMEQTTDGFKISEADLEIRGPGDFLGTRQVGMPMFQHANLMRDQLTLQLARGIAFEIIKTDFDLELPEHISIKQEFTTRYKDRLRLIGIG